MHKQLLYFFPIPGITPSPIQKSLPGWHGYQVHVHDYTSSKPGLAPPSVQLMDSGLIPTLWSKMCLAG